jgi:hypothetical protein
MPRRFVIALVAAAALGVLALPAGAAGATVRLQYCAPRPVPTATTLVASRLNLICRLNNYRRLHGLRPFIVSRALGIAEQGYIDRLIAYNATHTPRLFTHYLGGSTPLGRASAARFPITNHATHVGETLAWRYGPLANPAGGLAQTLTSPPHRAILLDSRFIFVGVGIAPVAPFDFTFQGATYGILAGCHC